MLCLGMIVWVIKVVLLDQGWFFINCEALLTPTGPFGSTLPKDRKMQFSWPKLLIIPETH